MNSISSKHSNKNFIFEDKFTDSHGVHTVRVERVDDNKYLVLVDKIHFSEIDYDNTRGWLEKGCHTTHSEIIGKLIEHRLS